VIHTDIEDRIRRALPRAAQLAGVSADARQLGILARAAAQAAVQVPSVGRDWRVPVRAQRQGPVVRDADVVLLRLIAGGLTTTGVAIELGVSPSAAGSQVKRLLGRLGVRSRVEAVAWACERGLLGGERG
jgi:DNA-binding CsgD family transcriptional regulator